MIDSCEDFMELIKVLRVISIELIFDDATYFNASTSKFFEAIQEGLIGKIIQPEVDATTCFHGLLPFRQRIIAPRHKQLSSNVDQISGEYLLLLCMILIASDLQPQSALEKKDSECESNDRDEDDFCFYGHLYFCYLLKPISFP